MTDHDLVSAIVDSLDDEQLATLAARLRPHLDFEDAGRMLDPREAAARLGLHERTIARMAREGRLPGAIKVGRRWRFPSDQLELLPASEPRPESAPRRRRSSRGGRRPSVRAIRDEA